MKRARRITEPLFTWFALWLAIHSLHWLLVHYFGSVLPPAFSPATWARDGINAFVVAVGMAAHEWNHKSQNHVLKHTAIGRRRRELPLRGAGKWLIVGAGLAPALLDKAAFTEH